MQFKNVCELEAWVRFVAADISGYTERHPSTDELRVCCSVADNMVEQLRERSKELDEREAADDEKHEQRMTEHRDRQATMAQELSSLAATLDRFMRDTDAKIAGVAAAEPPPGRAS